MLFFLLCGRRRAARPRGIRGSLPLGNDGDAQVDALVADVDRRVSRTGNEDAHFVLALGTEGAIDGLPVLGRCELGLALRLRFLNLAFESGDLDVAQANFGLQFFDADPQPLGFGRAVRAHIITRLRVVVGRTILRLRLRLARLLDGCLRPLVSIDVVTVSTSPVSSACTLATCGWLVSVSFATVRFDLVGSALSSATISRSLSSIERWRRRMLAEMT